MKTAEQHKKRIKKANKKMPRAIRQVMSPPSAKELEAMQEANRQAEIILSIGKEFFSS